MVSFNFVQISVLCCVCYTETSFAICLWNLELAGLSLRHFIIIQQVVITTLLQNLMILAYVKEEQKWITQKRIINIRSVVFISAFEILAANSWRSLPT